MFPYLPEACASFPLCFQQSPSLFWCFLIFLFPISSIYHLCLGLFPFYVSVHFFISPFCVFIGLVTFCCFLFCSAYLLVCGPHSPLPTDSTLSSSTTNSIPPFLTLLLWVPTLSCLADFSLLYWIWIWIASSKELLSPSTGTPGKATSDLPLPSMLYFALFPLKFVD